MRSLALAPFAALPVIVLACSSFSAVDAPADGGAPGATGPDASADGPVTTPRREPFVLDPDNATAIAAFGDSVFWLGGPRKIRGAGALPDRTVTEVAAASDAVVNAVGTDGVSIFWLEHGSFGGMTARVQRKVLAGDSTVTAASTGTDYTVFAVGPTAFLVGDTVSGRGFSSGGGLGPPIPHALNYPVVTSNALVYVYLARSIYETSLSDGVEVRLAYDLPDVLGLVADDAYVYAKLATGAIARIPHTARDLDAAANAPKTIATFDANSSALLAADENGQLVLWSDGDHALSQLSRDGDAPVRLRSDLRGVTSLAASGRGVFWTTSDGAAMWLPP